MTRAFLPCIAAITLTIAVLSLLPAQAQQRRGGPANTAPNLALVAKATTSFVSDWETLAALNDGFDPANSNDKTHGAYGNWSRTGTQWVQYDWSEPITTSSIDVYWFDDGGGVRVPAACRVKYWDGEKLVEVTGPSGLGLAPNRFNTTTFTEVTTTRLRLEMDSAGASSTGILECRVYAAPGSRLPQLPPAVKAGVDRVVVMPGSTYLNGSARSLSGTAGVALAWSKDSGPGEVTFADATVAVTSAKFSAPGEYVLKLKAESGPLSAADTLHVRVEPSSSIARLDPVYTKTYKINSTLWNGRLKPLIVNWIPHCIDQNSNLNLREGGIANFIEAAKKLRGEPAGRHVGFPFSNAWVYNTVESMCVALMVDPQGYQGDAEIIKAQEAMKAKLDEWIPLILAAQEPDGYLQTRFTLDTRGAQHWDARTRGEHEGYVAGYFLESAIAHHILTNGKDLRLYNAAKKLADCWYDNLGPAPKKAWYDGHQEMEQALVRFGRFVNDVEGSGKGTKYVELAKFLLDCRKGGSEYDQSHLPSVQQYEAVGHSVRASYQYSAMADVAMETGDIDYRSATASLWDNMVNRKYYLTGGLGSGETSEGFGPNYSLRNNAYCESCANCGNLFFQYKLNLASHDAKYADLYEDALYNAVLGDYDLAGNTFFYQNPLDGRNARTAWHNCPCCVGNFPRVLLMLPTWMYAKGPDGLYVNLFVGSTVTVENVTGTNVQMVQTTDYPWKGNVAITVNPSAAREFAIKVRVPSRNASTLYTNTPDASGVTSLAVNGSPVALKIEQGYAVIRRTWQAGDKIELVLPMTIQRVKASEKIAANAGRVALRYGPLIYNLESADQNIDAVLETTAALTTQWNGDLLGGVLTIKGAFSDGSPLTAIPNYARLNRGGRSLVWMRDK